MSELCADLIERALTTRRLGRPARFFPTIDSTNDVAHAEAATGAPDGLLVIADEQTAGRGRLERRWWAPPGTCLLLSLLLRPAIPLHRTGQLTMCLGLGAAEGIERVTGLAIQLKWPNDLLLHGRKLGGMLTELRAAGERLDYAVLGIGINVNFELGHHLQPAASELAETAISLQMALGRPVDRLALLAAILARTEAWYEGMLAGASPHAAWADRLATLGQRVRVTLPQDTLEGVATGVMPEGALILRDDDGHERQVWSGDVSAVRPTGVESIETLR